MTTKFVAHAGDVRNVFVYDCEYEDGNVLYCKSNLDRGGYIKDIYIKDLNVGKARILRLRNNYHGYRGVLQKPSSR